MALFEFNGHVNRHTNQVAVIDIERDDDGNVTKQAVLGEAIELNDDEQKLLASKGYIFEKTTKKEQEERVESGSDVRSGFVGADVAGAAPVFGGGTDADQTTGTDQR